jgi:adenylosuccinate lyase
MAMVQAGADRQVCHEEIRVLSHEAALQVKHNGLENDLLDRIKRSSYFEPIVSQLDQLLNPSSFIGRAPQQTEKFIASVQPLLQKYDISKIKKDELLV